MRYRKIEILGLMVPWLLLLLSRASAAVDIAPPGPAAVETIAETWTDAARANREVPFKIYYPAEVKEPAPVVIISHGLGGSRDGYGYLGRYLATNGYIAVHVTHEGSDTKALLGALAKNAGQPGATQTSLKAIATDPANAINRPRDISFTIDKLIEMDKVDGPLKGKIDVGHIGVAGHSFGAYTVLAVAGEKFFPGGTEVSAGERRIKAAIAMSPSARNAVARQFDAITIPMLVMTGTKDESPVAGTGTVDDRKKVFDLLIACDRYLLIFDGGDHMVFSGRPRGAALGNVPRTGGDASKDEAFQAFVKTASLHFFDAYLRDDAKAKTWLTSDDGAMATLGTEGTWTAKPKTK